MENTEERAANGQREEFWRKCPICIRRDAPSPEFEEFMEFINHMAEHLAPPQPSDEQLLYSPIPTSGVKIAILRDSIKRRGPDRSSAAAQKTKQKLSPQLKALLPMVAEWLEHALTVFPEINEITTSDIIVAGQLVDFARRLPDKFEEQRKHLLRHEQRLRETGMDPKWPRTPGSQLRFVAESMAGANWELSPSTSREFIRQGKPRKGAIPGLDQRWWEQTGNGPKQGAE